MSISRFARLRFWSVLTGWRILLSSATGNDVQGLWVRWKEGFSFRLGWLHCFLPILITQSCSVLRSSPCVLRGGSFTPSTQTEGNSPIGWNRRECCAQVSLSSALSNYSLRYFTCCPTQWKYQLWDSVVRQFKVRKRFERQSQRTKDEVFITF